MDIDWKSFLCGIASAIVIFLAIATFGFAHVGTVSSDSGSSSNIPEKCRPPAGQDLASWKEHLGHHAETKDCLKYFN